MKIAQCISWQNETKFAGLTLQDYTDRRTDDQWWNSEDKNAIRVYKQTRFI